LQFDSRLEGIKSLTFRELFAQALTHNIPPMRIATLMLLMPLVCLAQKQMQISGKLELSDDHFVLVLKDPISVDQDGDIVTSRRVQVVGITVSQYETLSNQIGHTVDLSGKVHHAYHKDHKEKLVIDPDSISKGSGTNARINPQRTDGTNDTNNPGWWYKFWYSLTTLTPVPKPTFVDPKENLIGTWEGQGVDATGTMRVDSDRWSMTLGKNGQAKILREHTYTRRSNEDWNSIRSIGDVLHAIIFWVADAVRGRNAAQRNETTWNLEIGSEPPSNCFVCLVNENNKVLRRSKETDHCAFIRFEKNGRLIYKWHIQQFTSNSLTVNTSNAHYYILFKKIE